MKYVIHEGKPEGTFNASSKAREDVFEIAEANGFTPFTIPSRYGVQKSVWKKPLQLYTYTANLQPWLLALDMFKPGDVLLIQYPLINTVYHFEKFLIEAARRGIKTYALIHDMDSLRFNVENSSSMVVNRVRKEDGTWLPLFTGLIAHNASMKKVLMEDYKAENVIELGIFDYLFSERNTQWFHTQKEPVVIAGNLDSQKAGYLAQLPRLKTRFHLYGANFDESTKSDNVDYIGKFKPERLVEALHGSFGLVWDGSSLETCESGFGGYLRYNNPHKLSLYIASELPVIVWKESALAPFVLENNIGIAIDSLLDLDAALRSLSEEDYKTMQANAARLAGSVRRGDFLKKALEQVQGGSQS